MKKSTLSIPEIIAIALIKVKNHDYDTYYKDHTVTMEYVHTRTSFFRSVRFYIGDMHYTVQFHRYRAEYPNSRYVFRSTNIPEGKYVVTDYTDTFSEYSSTRFISIMVEY